MEQKHVFISYVRENLEQVQRLCDELTKHGIKFWLDKNDIDPGSRWEDAILNAIESGDFFIACFSQEYNAKNESYMNEELTLAIERLRRIPRDRVWFIPVLFSGEVPKWRLGAGETLHSLQYVELYKDWDDGIQRIIKVIRPKDNVPKDDVEMVQIPAGEFQMGSNDGRNDEKPVHTVSVDEFFMDVYPVTNAQYYMFTEGTGYPAPQYWNAKNFNQSNQPVVGVTWFDAMAYAEWSGKRLPTEAEWEKAVRGGLVGKKYPWGNEKPDDKRANFNENVGKTTPVGNYPANSYGLYDMAGNVWEWCLDEYQKNFYKDSPKNNPLAGASNLSELLEDYKNVAPPRVLRGGSWNYNPFDLRVAVRDRFGRGYGSYYLGFRCVSPRFPQ
ncbi:MAG: SUMF1/EgtB/PvdO family nonheme iron enzyme [Planctomycetota bacterium]|jgi:formylglycine-generating enzyme required for sulfatase activity